MEILGVSVMIYCVFLLVVGILLFFYTVHDLNIEGFAGSGSGSDSVSGSYMTPLTAVYVKDCTVVSTCVSIGKDTDRLMYLQRLPVEGKLVSINGRYVCKYMATGMLVLYDIATHSTSGSSNILWSSNTKGKSLAVPAYLRNLGNIEAIATDGSKLPWIAVPNPDPMAGSTTTGSRSGSGSGSITISYAIPAIPNSGQYLQVTNYGDLVVMSPAGSIVWKANAGIPPVSIDPNACVPKPMTYPFTTADCYQLSGILKKNNELLTSLVTYGVLCEAGYYCPDNSTSNKENACPAGTYCPENTKLPISCAAGYYCPAQSAMQTACTTPGYYCPAGTISATQNPCMAGNVCSKTAQTPCVATASPTGVTTVAGMYCPAGATAPVSCDGMAAPGNYCPGGPAPITQCQAGYYCAGGTSQPVACTSVNLKGRYCPAGTNPWTPTMASTIKGCIYQSAIFTFAGSGTAGFADGAGPAAQFNTPGSLAVDSLGNIYMADTYNHCIRKITPGGVVSTLAGKGNPGFANGAGTTAMFNAPLGIAVDSAGNIYVADTYNHTIRKINSAGIVSTFAGSGNSNIYGSANGAGSAATFYYPSGIAIDSAGSVYVCDYGNTTIRKITSAGVVTTLAGSTTSGSADGTGAAASFYSPTAVAVDSTGNVYITDTGNSTIRKITSAGVVTTLAGTPMLGSTGSFADGVGAAARFNRPNGIAVGSAGRIYVADTLNNKIRLVIGSNVTTHAGSVQGGADSNITNGVMTDGTLKRPGGLVVITGAGSTDTVYVSDLDNNKIRKVVLIPDCDKITGLPLPCNTGSIPAGSYCLGGIIL